MGMFDDSEFWARVADERAHDRDMVTCGCGREVEWGDMVEIYDDMGIYAGKHCSEQCAERRYNLHMSRQDYAECGENIDDDY